MSYIWISIHNRLTDHFYPVNFLYSISSALTISGHARFVSLSDQINFLSGIKIQVSRQASLEFWKDRFNRAGNPSKGSKMWTKSFRRTSEAFHIIHLWIFSCFPYATSAAAPTTFGYQFPKSRTPKSFPTALCPFIRTQHILDFVVVDIVEKFFIMYFRDLQSWYNFLYFWISFF